MSQRRGGEERRCIAQDSWCGRFLYEALHKHTSLLLSRSLHLLLLLLLLLSLLVEGSVCTMSYSTDCPLRSSLTEPPPHCEFSQVHLLSTNAVQSRSFRPLLQLIITQAEVLQKVTANHLCRSQGSAVNRDTWTSLRAATSSSSSEACPCPGSALPVQHADTPHIEATPEVSW